MNINISRVMPSILIMHIIFLIPVAVLYLGGQIDWATWGHFVMYYIGFWTGILIYKASTVIDKELNKKR